MSAGKGDIKGGGRAVQVTPRKKHTKERTAHPSARRREKPETIILQGKAKSIPPKKSARRRTERPDFKVGNPRILLNQIAQALDENSFGPTAEILKKKSYWKALDLIEGDKVETSLEDLVTKRAKKLVEEKDSKHFIACISFLTDYVRKADLPEVFAPEIRDEINNYIVGLFTDHSRSSGEIYDELEKFFQLELVHNETVSALPRMREAIGQRLVGYFEKRSFTEFSEFLVVCRELGISYSPDDTLLSILQEHALSWLEASFENKENDPQDTLILLSQFMEKFEDMGVGLSSGQIRKRPALLANVQRAVAAVKSDEYVDEETDSIVNQIRGKFGPQLWRRLFW